MNKIPKSQMEPKQLERLAAQRELYSQAKKIHVFSTVLSVPVTVVFFILGNIFTGWQLYAACWGFLMTILNFAFLSKSEKTLRTRAAKIQEEFDCDVLELPWSATHVGSHADLEDIDRFSRKYIDKYGDYIDLENWYPVEAGRLPLHLARFVCQRSNVAWEVRLRGRYAFAIGVLITLIFLGGITVGFVEKMTIPDLLFFVFVPLLPAFTWGIRQYQDNREAATEIGRRKKFIDTIWPAALQKKKNRRH